MKTHTFKLADLQNKLYVLSIQQLKRTWSFFFIKKKYCLLLVPGQKQWQVIDVKGVWGQVRKPGIAHGMSSAAQPKEPAVQILGKERAPQVDDAASAIATQLEDGIDHGISGLNHNLSEPCYSLVRHYLDRHATLFKKKNFCAIFFIISVLYFWVVKDKRTLTTATVYPITDYTFPVSSHNHPPINKSTLQRPWLVQERHLINETIARLSIINVARTVFLNKMTSIP